ncbi:hypothetical protein M569_11772, partial [Genlisea aurea]
RSIQKALLELNSNGFASDYDDFYGLISNCIGSFKANPQYRDDDRFLKIWLLYMDGHSDYESVIKEMAELQVCTQKALLYESIASFLEVKGRFIDACAMYNLGISRNAQPLERLKKAQVLFLERMSERVFNGAYRKIKTSVSTENSSNLVNPWSPLTLKNLLLKMNTEMSQYEGYHLINKSYPGKVPLTSLLKSSRNKAVSIGSGEKYQIKGCAGQGGFAQVFKALINDNPDDVVALKIQKPPFPWEFYIYRQLDVRIPEQERRNFGFAHRVHLYTDYSVLVSDYLAHGTLQDAINSNVVKGGSMEEVLCMYYTIEMLRILETLGDAGVIHGDFKPDNLLIRYSRDDPTDDATEFRLRSGPWQNQGLCLVDWGRGIDLSLFPENTTFVGDSRTSGFRCIEMQESKPWTFQIDLYGLCVVVHMMLHNSYMEIERKPSPDDGTAYVYRPKSRLKR